MKNVTVKVITISSQLLVVTLFLTLVFSGGTNNQNITIGNNNFDKMADKTMTLFKSEELLLSSVDTSVVVPLNVRVPNSIPAFTKASVIYGSMLYLCYFFL